MQDYKMCPNYKKKTYKCSECPAPDCENRNKYFENQSHNNVWCKNKSNEKTIDRMIYSPNKIKWAPNEYKTF